MRKCTPIIVCLVLLFAWWAWQAAQTSAKGKGHGCDIVGTWYSVGSDGTERFYDMTPHGSSGNMVACVGEQITGIDPTFGGVFPNAVAQTFIRGDFIRSSPDTYDWTLYQYAMNADGQMEYQVVISGMSVMVTCDSTVALFAYEILDPEGTQLLCDTGYTYNKRMPLVQPCTDLPPMPE